MYQEALSEAQKPIEYDEDGIENRIANEIANALRSLDFSGGAIRGVYGSTHLLAISSAQANFELSGLVAKLQKILPCVDVTSNNDPISSGNYRQRYCCQVDKEEDEIIYQISPLRH